MKDDQPERMEKKQNISSYLPSTPVHSIDPIGFIRQNYGIYFGGDATIATLPHQDSRDLVVNMLNQCEYNIN